MHSVESTSKMSAKHDDDDSSNDDGNKSEDWDWDVDGEEEPMKCLFSELYFNNVEELVKHDDEISGFSK